MGSVIANAEMAASWDGEQGEHWANSREHYDRSLSAHHQVLMEAASVQPDERVLDIGCGNGQVTRAAAKAAGQGHALGIDLSSQMLEVARRLADNEGLANVAFEQADAQVYDFGPAAFDLVLSRFGCMFFVDPIGAFSNIRAAVRPGGRMVLAAWQGVAANEWMGETTAAIAMGRDVPRPPPGAPGPLAFAEPSATKQVLEDAGWANVDLVSMDLPFWSGANPDAAYDFLLGVGMIKALLQDLSDEDRARALEGLRAVIDVHATPEGVFFKSGIWLIRALNP